VFGECRVVYLAHRERRGRALPDRGDEMNPSATHSKQVLASRASNARGNGRRSWRHLLGVAVVLVGMAALVPSAALGVTKCSSGTHLDEVVITQHK
jgi:hypothetical protein